MCGTEEQSDSFLFNPEIPTRKIPDIGLKYPVEETILANGDWLNGSFVEMWFLARFGRDSYISAFTFRGKVGKSEDGLNNIYQNYYSFIYQGY